MVRSTKNNRSKRRTKVSLPKQPNKYRVAAARRGWDTKKTALQNLSSRGLVSNPNSEVSLKAVKALRLAKLSGAEVLEMVDGVAPPLLLGDLEGRNPSRSAFFMKREEVEYLSALVEKYKTNYVAMARDLKVNSLQHSAAHLETRCKRMVAWAAEQAAGAAAGGGGGAAAAAAAGSGAGGMEVEQKKKKVKAAAAPAPEEEEEDDGFRAFAINALTVRHGSKLR